MLGAPPSEGSGAVPSGERGRDTPPAAGERVGVVDAVEKTVYSSTAPPRAGLTSARTPASGPDLVVAIAVQVEHVPRETLARAQRRFGLREIAPDRVPQMRQVEPAEDAVPVGIVALRPADGATHRGRIAGRRASALSAIIFLCIRFDSGYLTRKFRQCGPRIARRRGRRHGPRRDRAPAASAGARRPAGVTRLSISR